MSNRRNEVIARETIGEPRDEDGHGRMISDVFKAEVYYSKGAGYILRTQIVQSDGDGMERYMLVTGIVKFHNLEASNRFSAAKLSRLADAAIASTTFSSAREYCINELKARLATGRSY